jgi:magnesium transporter
VQVLDHFDEAQLTSLLSEGHPVWLSLYHPSPADLEAAGRVLGLHELAIASSVRWDQRAKIDDYEGTALLVFHGLTTGEPDQNGERLPEPVEVHFHLGPHGVMTVRHRDLDTFLEARQQVRESHVDEPEEALFLVLDALAASYSEPLATVEGEIDEMEDVLIDTPEPAMRRRLLDIKHALVRVRHVVDPQRDVLASHRDLLDGIDGFGGDHAHDLLRDLYDRLALTSQEVDSIRELISNALDLYVSAVSNKLNQVMKVLTIVATFFLPLTFITGFFGQNFGWLVRHVGSATAFWVFGPGVAVVFVALLYMAFVRAGYLAWPPHFQRKAAAPPPAGPRASRRSP